MCLSFLCLSECVAHCFEKVDLTSSVIGFKTRDVNGRFLQVVKLSLTEFVWFVITISKVTTNILNRPYLDDYFKTKRININQIIKLSLYFSKKSNLEHPEAE